jgi:hypothetical protein
VWRKLFGVKRDRSVQEFLTYFLHVTCEKLDFLPRMECTRSLPFTQPSAPMMRQPYSEGESCVRGTLSSMILETNSGRGINMMQIVEL